MNASESHRMQDWLNRRIFLKGSAGFIGSTGACNNHADYAVGAKGSRRIRVRVIECSGSHVSNISAEGKANHLSLSIGCSVADGSV